MVKGAKVNDKRGQPVRKLAVPIDNTAASGLAALVQERGGLVVSMTDVDHRNLNRALKPSSLSIYSIRHAVGSELKRQVQADPGKAEKAATFMGHSSTRSLASCGRSRHAHGGWKFWARAERAVRSVPTTHRQREVVRQKNKEARKAAAAGVTIASAIVTRIPKPGELSLPIPKPAGLKPPRGPKPTWKH
ncbi:hypothetical protein [Burkholderia sp. LMG 32019]|uniref:hypothetical protein n=1 Tax=Burkholderia sp. LMG 32019 TaxID=3158173 RepID=UPI003C2DDB5C